MTIWPCLLPDRDGVLLSVHAIPGSRHGAVVGLHDGALRIRVAARAVDGEANQALLRWLSDQLGIQLSQCELRRGATSRRKQILLRGVEPAAVQRWLEAQTFPSKHRGSGSAGPLVLPPGERRPKAASGG